MHLFMQQQQERVAALLGCIAAKVMFIERLPSAAAAAAVAEPFYSMQ